MALADDRRAATLLAGFVLFSLLGKDPWQALLVFFVTPIETRHGFGELVLKASPLALCAVGLAAGYRANVWNIGAEGQLYAGCDLRRRSCARLSGRGLRLDSAADDARGMRRRRGLVGHSGVA